MVCTYIPESAPRIKKTDRPSVNLPKSKFGAFKITTIHSAPSEPIATPYRVQQFWENNIQYSPVFHPNKEHLVVITLNVKYHLTGWNLVSMGSVNESIAHPREIFMPVIAAGAYAFILVHNHPSGDPSPSHSDTAITKVINDGALLLKLHFLDHVIVGNGTHFSFKESGLIRN
jgi:DNA repair protein RadC